MRVQVDPVALAGTGLTLEDVRTALVAANVNQPKGNLDGPRQDYTHRRPTISSPRPSAFAPLIIAYKNGAPVRLRDVADVRRRRRERAARRLGRTSSAPIILNVQRQPGANVIEVADRVKALLPQLAGVAAAGDRRQDPDATAPRPCARRSTTWSSRWC